MEPAVPSEFPSCSVVAADTGNSPIEATMGNTMKTNLNIWNEWQYFIITKGVTKTSGRTLNKSEFKTPVWSTPNSAKSP